MKHIILIGMMGSGKTTVGRIISQITGRIFIDTDQLIEKKLKMSIFDIITKRGEDFFRSIEKEVILSLNPSCEAVIATGGGAVMDNEVFLYLKVLGKLVYLKTAPSILNKRTLNVNTRPLLKGENRLDIIQELLKKREARYQDVDFIIETDNHTPYQVAEQIIRKFRQ